MGGNALLALLAFVFGQETMLTILHLVVLGGCASAVSNLTTDGAKGRPYATFGWRFTSSMYFVSQHARYLSIGSKRH